MELENTGGFSLRRRRHQKADSGSYYRLLRINSKIVSEDPGRVGAPFVNNRIPLRRLARRRDEEVLQPAIRGQGHLQEGRVVRVDD